MHEHPVTSYSFADFTLYQSQRHRATYDTLFNGFLSVSKMASKRPNLPRIIDVVKKQKKKNNVNSLACSSGVNMGVLRTKAYGINITSLSASSVAVTSARLVLSYIDYAE